jgi:hypothetical protein
MEEEVVAPEQIREEKLVDLASGDLTRSTRALLYLTYEDPDRHWLERLLLDQLGTDKDPQLRSLAVTCMGHVGRMHGVVGEKVVDRLRQLLSDEALAGFAENALDDIESLARVEKL